MMAKLQVPSQTIVLDAVGTLIRPTESISATYQRLGARHGILLEHDVIRRRFAECRRKFFPNDSNQPSDDDREKTDWAKLVGQVFEELPDCRDLFQDLWEFYAEPNHWSLFPEVPDCLSQMLSGGFRLAIGSNFDRRLVGICQKLAPLAQIPFVFYSGALGFRKPDPRFYMAIRRRLPAQSQPPLMVGDDLEKDIRAAQQAGWLVRHVDRPEQNLMHIVNQLEFGA